MEYVVDIQLLQFQFLPPNPRHLAYRSAHRYQTFGHKDAASNADSHTCFGSSYP